MLIAIKPPINPIILNVQTFNNFIFFNKAYVGKPKNSIAGKLTTIPRSPIESDDINNCGKLCSNDENENMNNLEE